MNRTRIVTFFVGLVVMIGQAFALPVITTRVIPSVGPNASTSPSWLGYAANALMSLASGGGDIGDGSSPTDYVVAGATVPPGSIITSNFHSWLGVADPSPPVDLESGNQPYGGFTVTGGGGNPMFRLNDLAFDITSSDESHALNYSGTFAGRDYDATTYGVDFGLDREEGGGDDIVYTSGNGLTPVDMIVSVGASNSIDASFAPGATNQDKLDAVLAYVNNQLSFEVSFTYTMYAPDGNTVLSQSGNSVIVPSPGATALMILGGVAGFGRQRRHRLAA